MIVYNYITPNPGVYLQYDDRRWLIPYLKKIFQKDNIKDIKDILKSKKGFFEIPLRLGDNKRCYFLSMDEEKYDCKVKIPIEDIKEVLEERRIDFAQLVEYVKNDIFNIQKTEFVLYIDKNYKTWVCLPTSIYKEKDNVKEYIAKAKKTIPNISKCNEVVSNNIGKYVILCDKVIFRFKISNPYPNPAFLEKPVVCIEEELIEKYGFKKLS